ncbi:hypothetical protein L3Q82_023188 [Scortum barcoo]|uniref:Uncharacterized protein n=1 Tax=Scortum barcoo TaxID=214431 RepID=A0ACB8WYB8_9TELE|nr:hypothetical protein L3Q82_023188 [Scortum barcoo]
MIGSPGTQQENQEAANVFEETVTSCPQLNGKSVSQSCLMIIFFCLQGNSAEAWELIRNEIQTHLMRADLLASSLLTAN